MNKLREMWEKVLELNPCLKAEAQISVTNQYLALQPELLAVVESARLLDECATPDCPCQSCETLRAVRALDAKLTHE